MNSLFFSLVADFLPLIPVSEKADLCCSIISKEIISKHSHREQKFCQMIKVRLSSMKQDFITRSDGQP